MGKKTEKIKEQKNTKDGDLEFFYADNSIKKSDFSDRVKVTSYPHGMVLSFSVWSVSEKKHCIFKEVLLPFDVAMSLKDVMDVHFKDLLKNKLIKIEKVGNERTKPNKD